MSRSTLTPLTLEEFGDHISTCRVCRGRPTATCAHHTEEPTAATWRGKRSMVGIRHFHETRRDGKDIFANFYVGPDDHVWTARPLDERNWAHAAKPSRYPWSKVDPDVRAFCEGDGSALNKHAVGVEIVGNFDSEDPEDSAAMSLALDVFAVMHTHWQIPVELLFFHRMISPKTCPGSRVSVEWFRREVAQRIPLLASPVAVVGPGEAEIDCAARLENGRTVCQIAPVLDALRVPYYWEAPHTLLVGDPSLVAWFRDGGTANMASVDRAAPAVVVIGPGRAVINCKARLEGSRTVCQVSPVLEAVDIPYAWQEPRTLLVG